MFTIFAWILLLSFNIYVNIVFGGNLVVKFRGDDYCDPECIQYIRPGNLKYMIMYKLKSKSKYIVAAFICTNIHESLNFNRYGKLVECIAKTEIPRKM